MQLNQAYLFQHGFYLLLMGLIISPLLGETTERADRPITTLNNSSSKKAPWWTGFEDKTLTDLIARAIKNNHDLAKAAEGIIQAEATAIKNRAKLFPSLNLSGSYLVAPYEALGFQSGFSTRGTSVTTTGLPDNYYSGSASLNVRYQLDGWGRFFSAYRAMRYNAFAKEWDRDAIGLALTIRVAQAYFDAIFARQKIEIIQSQIKNSRDFLKLIQSRFEQGESSALTVLQQKQQFAGTKANLPSAKIQYHTSILLLETLLGGIESIDTLKFSKKLPTLSPIPLEPKYAEILKNRPDINAAVLRKKAAKSQKTSNILSNLPTVELSGKTGYDYFKALNENTQQSWSARINFSFPLFSGFGDMANVREAQANENMANESLKQLKLKAKFEIKNAFLQEEQQRSHLKALEELYQSAFNAYKVSKLQYLDGLAIFTDLFSSLNAMQNAEINLLRARRSILSARIRIYHTLGSEWLHTVEKRQGD